ncbi:anthranilate synthase component I [Streptomyces sp. N2-109]|uniref:Anthranilate synthase n=1 Tax=Streptomyces gossypii TaxID=2883101 RepID=A0ABT2JLX8_9ACTN|nr:anthranilate synthase component I [Streptomyces gossypii]MCT2588875.1 anthranilate synthase component I [Streptomyces gossypii]
MSSLPILPARPQPDAASEARWGTPAGVGVLRVSQPMNVQAAAALATLEKALDERRGMLLHRGVDRVVGYVDPPLEINVTGGLLAVRALNARGRVLLPALRPALAEVLRQPDVTADVVSGLVPPPGVGFAEEDRTRHSGVFAALRTVKAALASREDSLLGLYGAFGYDLIFQMEQIELHQERNPQDRDMVLHLPDEIMEFDLGADQVRQHRYDFRVGEVSTLGMRRDTPALPFSPGTTTEPRERAPGEYARLVERAMPRFAAGDLFEVVPGQVFRRGCAQPPSTVFRRLRETNPAPHSLLANLGGGEYLIGASPEMFVRVHRTGELGQEREMVESSPISGTIARGRDALEDAARIRELLDSVKEESELTMCTDVDRNDKARVCVPGTVRLTARRQTELYSTLIHTVDRVEGEIAPGRDALDGFLAHLWAVTVTGAPKLAAVEFLEREERSPRRWYGGAVGSIGFDGSLDTVLTLRTIQVRDGVATVRAGATLLHDSSPEAEEAETELKASALLNVLDPPRSVPAAPARTRTGDGLRIVLVDHRDSFVNCLADYLRQTGAEVTTYRSGRHLPVIERQRPDLVVLSPGPGRPADFGLGRTLELAERLELPVFGVCLGLQGLVEYYGGGIGVLERPVHGKPSRVRVTDADSPLLAGLPKSFEVGRYHSLYALADALPAELRITAETDDGVPMAVEHAQRPFAAVQFHPESLMSLSGRIGHTVVDNAVRALTRRPRLLSGTRS